MVQGILDQETAADTKLEGLAEGSINEAASEYDEDDAAAPNALCQPHAADELDGSDGKDVAGRPQARGQHRPPRPREVVMHQKE